jgi:hypothetical protein
LWHYMRAGMIGLLGWHALEGEPVRAVLVSVRSLTVEKTGCHGSDVQRARMGTAAKGSWGRVIEASSGVPDLHGSRIFIQITSSELQG